MFQSSGSMVANRGLGSFCHKYRIIYNLVPKRSDTKVVQVISREKQMQAFLFLPRIHELKCIGLIYKLEPLHVVCCIFRHEYTNNIPMITCKSLTKIARDPRIHISSFKTERSHVHFLKTPELHRYSTKIIRVLVP